MTLNTLNVLKQHVVVTWNLVDPCEVPQCIFLINRFGAVFVIVETVDVHRVFIAQVKSEEVIQQI